MSRLTDIKQRILQLEAGAFQELCDAYLSKLGYADIVALGMKPGTQKTTKGIPDTYFVMDDGKYVFVMYTAQQAKLIGKIEQDVLDCLNPEKTKIEIEYISEIICCHTSSNINAGEDNRLKQMCKDKGIVLSIYGIDKIALDIYEQFHGIARDFLNISVSTDQIFTFDGFLESYDSNSLAAPLKTHFQNREKELTFILDCLQKEDITILYGNAGVGKTRLALECCRIYAEQKKCKLLCIRSKSLPLYEDLKIELDTSDHYLIFIDDANQITNFEEILQYLFVNSKLEVKILIAVRDYARQVVVEKARGYSMPAIVKIDILTDKEIEELLDINLGIKNEKYLKKISQIVNGNARLAMMAGKIAIDKQSLDSINDSSELYERYYGNYTNIGSNKITRIAAGIVAFFSIVNLDEEKFKILIVNLGYSFEEIEAALNYLHEGELIDIYKNKIVKISDQCFANYVLYCVFVKERIIPYSRMIKECFVPFRKSCVDATNTIGHIFNSQSVRDFLQEEIDDLWRYFEKKDDQIFFEFVKVFHEAKPIETLVLLKNIIDAVEREYFDIAKIDFLKEERHSRIEDDILKIIGSYNLSHNIDTALDLFFLYLNKKPSLFMEFYHTVDLYFSIDQNSYQFDYYSQEHVVNKFVTYSDNGSNAVVTELFLRVSEMLLKLYYNPAEAGRGRTITYYRIPMRLTDGSKKYRDLIWNNLLTLYKNPNYALRIEKIIYCYGERYNEEINSDLVNYDCAYIIRFFNDAFSSKNPLHCRIVDTVVGRIDRFYNVHIDQAEYCNYLANEDYLLYAALSKDQFDTEDCEEGYKSKEENIRKIIDKDPRTVIIRIFEVLKLFEADSQAELWKLQEGLGIAFMHLYNNPEDFIYAIDAYLQNDTPFQYYSDKVFDNLFDILGDQRTLELITKHSYRQKNTWQFFFFKNLPHRYINNQYASEFCSFLWLDEGELNRCPMRDLVFLEKYLAFDRDIYVRASRIIYDKHKDHPFLFGLYFDMALHRFKKPEELIERYKKDIDLLKKIYLNLLKKNSDDEQGELLLALINVVPSILDEYIELITEGDLNYGNCDRISVIWRTANYMELANKIFFSFYKNESISDWRKALFVQNMFKCKKQEDILIERQDSWIKCIIENQYNESLVIKTLFNCISILPPERKKKHILLFISLNDDSKLFSEIQLEEFFWMGDGGSMIPVLEKRILFLESLLPSLNGLKYLKHKYRVEDDIKRMKNRIEQEQIDEIMQT